MIKYLRTIIFLSSVCFTQNIFAQNGACIPSVGLDCVTAPKFIDSVFTTNALANFSNNSTGCNAQDQNYEYYQNKVVIENAGANFTLHVGLNPVAVVFVGIWIDWNNDLTFSTGEQIYLSSGQNTTVSLVVNVPITAVIDTLILRVRSGTTLTGPCDSTDAGETEDYILIVVGTSGIAQPFADDAWTIYPNPANDFLNVVVAENSGDEEIFLIDLLGNVLISEKINGGKSTLDLSELPHGMYFVRMNSNGEVGLKKFVH